VAALPSVVELVEAVAEFLLAVELAAELHPAEGPAEGLAEEPPSVEEAAEASRPVAERAAELQSVVAPRAELPRAEATAVARKKTRAQEAAPRQAEDPVSSRS
jgi:hypothetical protein